MRGSSPALRSRSAKRLGRTSAALCHLLRAPGNRADLALLRAERTAGNGPNRRGPARRQSRARRAQTGRLAARALRIAGISRRAARGRRPHRAVRRRTAPYQKFVGRRNALPVWLGKPRPP